MKNLLILGIEKLDFKIIVIMVKSLKRKIGIVTVLYLAAQLSFGQNVTLNVPSNLSNKTTPPEDKSVQYTVSLQRNDCVNIYGASAGSTGKELSTSSPTLMPRGAVSELIATVKLQEVTTNVTASKEYIFGSYCAENSLADANVQIKYYGDNATQSSGFQQTSAIRLPVSGSDFLTIDGNDTPDNNNVSQDYLKVLANPENTATISINHKSDQGKVMVMIFSESGQAIALLNPKSHDPQSFTVEENVLVVPIIQPTERIESGMDTIYFEVGDPEKNGKIIVEEI